MPPPSPRRIFFYKLTVFVLTFFTYAAVHSCRSVWSYSKDNLQNDPEFHFTQDFFGTCDLVFLLCYSMSLYLFGWIGDKIDLRLYLAIGLVGTCTSFGTLGWMRFSNYRSEPLFAFFMGLNGMFQSVGWPGSIAIMGNWFGPEKRGLIMGVWSGNPNIGNIIGYEFGSITIDHMKLGYNYTIMCSIVFVLGMLILLCLFVHPYPEKLGIKVYASRTSKANSINKSVDSASADKPLGFWKAITLPGVAIYTLGYTCTKATSYGILFWLASYLKSKHMDDNASGISQVNEVGQFIGGLTLGLLNDRFNRKALFMPFFLIMAAVFFILVRFTAGDSVSAYYVLMFFCGFFLGGPFNIISSAIAADLGKNPAIKGNKKALSTVSGIIEGSGSLGAAIVQKVIPYMESQIFVILAILCAIGGFIVTPTAWHEYQRKVEKAKKSKASLLAEEDHSLKKQLKEMDHGSNDHASNDTTTLNLKT